MRKYQRFGNPRDPNIWIDLSNFYPTERGTYRTAPTFTTLGTAGAGPSTPGTGLAAVALPTASGTTVVYVGTSTKLYSASTTNFRAGSFTDRSKAGGYTATNWSFAQFGNFTIAAGGHTDNVQVRDATGSSAFADLAGTPPKAKIVVVQSNVALLFNLSTGNSSWAASDVGDHTNWSTGDAVTATPILHRPGEITAAVAFRDSVIVFKKDSIYQMRYVGSPIYWTVELIEDGRGASTQGAVCNCGNFLIFRGEHGATIFDGASFRDITVGFNGISGNALASGTNTSSIYFPTEKSVVFCDGGSGMAVYNIQSDAWGYFYIYKSGDVSGATDYVMVCGPPTCRYDAIGALGKNIANRGIMLVKVSASGTGVDDVVLQSQNDWTPASNVDATIRTGYFGDERQLLTLKRVTPILCDPLGQHYPLASTGLRVKTYVGDRPDIVTASSAVTSSTGTNRFDVQRTGRFIGAELYVTGVSYEIEDFVFDVVPAGTD